MDYPNQGLTAYPLLRLSVESACKSRREKQLSRRLNIVTAGYKAFASLTPQKYPSHLHCEIGYPIKSFREGMVHVRELSHSFSYYIGLLLDHIHNKFYCPHQEKRWVHLGPERALLLVVQKDLEQAHKVAQAPRQ